MGERRQEQQTCIYPEPMAAVSNTGSAGAVAAAAIPAQRLQGGVAE